MGKEATLVIDCNRFNQEACSGRLFEISDTEYTVGKTIYFDVHGISADLIANLYLLNGCTFEGLGTFSVDINEEVQEIINFSGESRNQLMYPADAIIKITANTDLVTIDTENNTISCYASKGTVISGMQKIGYSCIGFNDETTAVYGSVKVRYYKCKFKKRWSWTVPNRSGVFYFFLLESGKVVHQWTTEVESEEDAGGVLVKDITINVSDYVTDSLLEDVTVYLDGVNKGTTDADGNIDISNVTVGHHTVKFTKTGYLDSDEDDLDNDEFTLSSDI